MPFDILVIDDDEAIVPLIELCLLHMSDVVLHHAPNGRRGIELAVADPPDLILLDFEMPVMDGLETLRQLRANGRTAHTPIVAITASNGNRPRSQEMIAGCDAYLPKPFDVMALSQTVQNMQRQG